MKRLTLIHWHGAEARNRARRLRESGYQVRVLPDADVSVLRREQVRPPLAFVIDLSRLPAQGRDVGVFLRRQQATRMVPLVYVEGSSASITRVRKQLPDAIFARWRTIRSAINNALRKPPKDPVVPGTMDAYSGTPLPKKLGIKPGSVVALLGAPEGFERNLDPIPRDTTLRRHARGKADRVLLFARTQADLRRRLGAAERTMAPGGALWIAWPKKKSGVRTDLTEQHVRAAGLNDGLVDYKICAIDDIWSGLCFARRKRASPNSVHFRRIK